MELKAKPPALGFEDFSPSVLIMLLYPKRGGRKEIARCLVLVSGAARLVKHLQYFVVPGPWAALVWEVLLCTALGHGPGHEEFASELGEVFSFLAGSGTGEIVSEGWD